MLLLNLGDCQGYPQTINMVVSDLRGAATLQDVLRVIHEILRMPFSKRKLDKLGGEEWATGRSLASTIPYQLVCH